MMTRRDLVKSVGLGATGLLLGGSGSAVAHSAEPTRGPNPAHDAFEHYERRFAEARLRMPDRNPALPDDRKAILLAAKACLGVRDDWTPTIRTHVVREAAFDGGRIELLRSETWPGVVGTALLYVPAQPAGKPAPLVILCCGHGAGGKLTPGYQRMARHLARCGAMVLCPDNLGQGERKSMGHANCVKPFACGASVQGLIVMETLGWVAWARGQSRFDPRRLAAIGNSGGGTLTVFLAAFSPDLAVLSSSGYPSTFDFVARKEKKHCHCNVLPGVVGQVEMWHLLGAFAPRPMFIFQGSRDSLFPEDLFYHAARKLRDVYRALNAEAAFRASSLPGEHSWDAGRIAALGGFLTKQLNLHGKAKRVDENEPLLSEQDRCLETWPADALDTDRLAEQLTGRRVGANLNLWDVFPPSAPAEALAKDIAYRGSTRQILAQFEAFLTARSQP